MNGTSPAATVVVSDLKAAEQATDANIAALTQLMASVLEGSRSVDLRFGATQGVIADLAKAMESLSTARHHVCRAHEQMRRVAEREGLVRLYGDVDPTFKKDDVLSAAHAV